MKTKRSKSDFELASNFTVADYERARDAKVPNRDVIADAISRRFLERYIAPVSHSTKKHGFAIMAVSCLMIEALESFRQGWVDTKAKGRGLAAFRSFFDRADSFSSFRGHAGDFYTHVRCGILHQAETTGGWLIRRSGPLFDPDGLTINATKFLRALETFLNDFCSDLKNKPWDCTEWKHIVTKMNAIVKHCE